MGGESYREVKTVPRASEWGHVSKNFKRKKLAFSVWIYFSKHTTTHTSTYPDIRTEKWQNGSNMPTNRFKQKLVRSDLSRFRKNLRVLRFSFPSEAITTKNWSGGPEIFLRCWVCNRCWNSEFKINWMRNFLWTLPTGLFSYIFNLKESYVLLFF